MPSDYKVDEASTIVESQPLTEHLRCRGQTKAGRLAIIAQSFMWMKPW
jgi:hypothetical protein